MTYIPGTGEIKTESPVQVKKRLETPELVSVVNVNELKHPEEKEEEPESIWYFQLKYWMIFGGIFSAFFAILAIFNYRFLFLLPLGPYVAYLSWHIRKKIKKYSKHFDAFS